MDLRGGLTIFFLKKGKNKANKSCKAQEDVLDYIQFECYLVKVRGATLHGVDFISGEVAFDYKLGE